MTENIIGKNFNDPMETEEVNIEMDDQEMRPIKEGYYRNEHSKADHKETVPQVIIRDSRNCQHGYW